MAAMTSDMRRAERGLRGLRLTRRGKVALAILCLALMAGILGVTTQAVAGEPMGGVEVEAVIVRQGQSMWNFAAKVAGPGEDLRNVVNDLKALNGLDDVSLQVGQKLLLPVRSSVG